MYTWDEFLWAGLFVLHIPPFPLLISVEAELNKLDISRASKEEERGKVSLSKFMLQFRAYYNLYLLAFLPAISSATKGVLWGREYSEEDKQDHGPGKPSSVAPSYKMLWIHADVLLTISSTPPPQILSTIYRRLKKQGEMRRRQKRTLRICKAVTSWLRSKERWVVKKSDACHS